MDWEENFITNAENLQSTLFLAENVQILNHSIDGLNYLNGNSNFEYGNFSGQFYDREFIFDRLYVRVLFITLYSLVFCCCFLGEK